MVDKEQNLPLEPNGEAESTDAKKKVRPRRWLRRLLRVVCGIVIFMLLIPVLLYVPFIQTIVKDVACDIVSKSTGMHVSIDRFRLKFPVDIELDKVLMTDEKGDTALSAGSLVADVKMIPLFKLDVQVNKVDLHDAYYKMVSPDSSMTLQLAAGNLRIAGGSNVNIKSGDIKLRQPSLKNARINVNINVWKQTPDSVYEPTPWAISADRLRLENVNFSMEMLPTISKLDLHIAKGTLDDALIDLRNNRIQARRFDAAGGKAVYLTPDADYIASHPVPVDTISPPSPPMVVAVDTINLTGGWKALYGVAGAKPLPGFDPSYIEVEDVELSITDFYNKAAVVRLPIKSIQARERSGLRLTSGSGTVSVDSVGIRLDSLQLTTPYSRLYADADVSFALMEMAPQAPVMVRANGSVGFADIYAFMPSLRSMLGFLPQSNPLQFDVDAQGTLSALRLNRFTASIARYASLNMVGDIINPLTPDKLEGKITLDGRLDNSAGLNGLLRQLGVDIPTFSIKGDIAIKGSRYDANLSFKSPRGDASLDGYVSLTPERYDVDATLQNFNLGAIMPSLGVGTVSAHLRADGAGFNPLIAGARSNVHLTADRLEYGGFNYAPLKLDAVVSGSHYTLDADIANPNLDLAVKGDASRHGSTYSLDLTADVRHIDARAMGFTLVPCEGSAQVSVAGDADIDNMLFDLDMSLGGINWNYNEALINIPHALDATFISNTDGVSLKVEGEAAYLAFTTTERLMPLFDRFTAATTLLTGQIDSRDIDMEALRTALPPFTIKFDAGGGGVLSQLVNLSGFGFNSIEGEISNSDTFGGNMRLLSFDTGSVQLDTVTLNLSQRAKMLDYKLHIGNRAANLPEFASVNLSGYVGGNRASLFAKQSNAKGETGYRLGLTAAMLDSTVSVHLTPLNSIIGYKPWEINDDNHIDVSRDFKVDADLSASSGTSRVELHSGYSKDGHPALNVGVTDLNIQDFLQMSVFAPPVTGKLNTSLMLVFREKSITGNGSVGLANLTYNRIRVGDLQLDVKAGMGYNGGFGGKIDLLLDNKAVLTARGSMMSDSIKNERTRVALTLNRFPLKTLNPFIGPNMAQLSGTLSGDMVMTGSFADPLVNGALTCDSVGVYVPMLGSTYRFDSTTPIAVADNLLRFDNFNIYGANSNPLSINGTVDARRLSDILFDITMDGNNVALVNNDRRARSDIYGKLFVNLNAAVRGSLNNFNVNLGLTVLPATDISYTLPTATSELQQITSTTDVVKFVVFADSTAVVKPAEESQSSMSLNATVSIVNGARATVNLSTNGTDKVQVNPYGNLNFTMSPMGDMRMAGQLNLASGFARYSVPLIGEKTFEFSPSTYVLWNGDIMNPLLNISATDYVKANVQQQGQNSRLINFDVTLDVTGTLSSPKVLFGLSTDEDMTVQNELLSMSPDQRSTAAINLMLTNTYTGQGVKATSNLAGNPLYSFLEAQLNSWAAKNIRGVDLSFGIDQYDRTVDGQSNTTTSYSYQLSKSLFDNRFKIVVGGNYSTNASADENFVENLFSDISFEYMLKQTQNLNMYFKLFRHTGFESILEGEITETGLGFVMKRKISTLRNLLRFGQRRKAISVSRESTASPIGTPADSLITTSNDSIPTK